MTSPRRDTFHVPLSANSPPYRIDEATDGDCCVRIGRRGPDLLVLVPPGDSAREFRARLIGELQAYSVRSIGTRRYDLLLSVLLFGVLPAMLLGLAGFMTAGLFGFLEDTAPVAVLTLLVGYVLILLARHLGLTPMLMSAAYPADPADALRDMPTSALRYLSTDELSGGPAMKALRRTLLDSPSSIRPEERSALWILAARDEYYASALSATRRLAQLRFQETLRAHAREFSIEMQVALDDLESVSGMAPPTSAW